MSMSVCTRMCVNVCVRVRACAHMYMCAIVQV